MNIQVQAVPPMQVLCSSHQITLADINQVAGVVVKEIYAEAVQAGWQISGACIFIYNGCDDRPDTVFDLDIAVPVQGNGKAGRFSVKKLPPFRTVQALHEGEWTKLTDTCDRLFAYAQEHRLPLTGEIREVYVNVDFVTPEHNRTEVQVGVQ